MTVGKHLHRYEKVKLGKQYIVFRCTLPACTHFVRWELAKGKLCVCNRCGEPMVLNAFAMQFKHPHCHSCTVKKDDNKIDEGLREALAEKLGNV